MQGILGEFPGYIDCYLRLACLQARRGDLEAAHEWAAKALAASNNHPDCLAVQGDAWQTPAVQVKQHIACAPKLGKRAKQMVNLDAGLTA